MRMSPSSKSTAVNPPPLHAYPGTLERGAPVSMHVRDPNAERPLPPYRDGVVNGAPASVLLGGRLAREFGCAPWFVGRITSLKAADRRVAVAARDEEHAAHRAKWGERRTMNAEIRKKRREFW